VDYAVTGGTATGGGEDYVLADGSLAFNPGQTSQTIDVTIVDDDLDEGNETIRLTLNKPQNATLGAVSMARLVIEDDDYAVYLPLVLHQFP
jgi:hypothetical protein